MEASRQKPKRINFTVITKREKYFRMDDLVNIKLVIQKASLVFNFEVIQTLADETVKSDSIPLI